MIVVLSFKICYNFIRVECDYMLSKLKKFFKEDFDLKGYELIIFQVIFMLGFQVGSYSIPFIRYKYKNVFNILFIVSIVLILFLIIYYIVRMIKTKRYINLWILISYVILFFVDAYILYNSNYDGFLLLIILGLIGCPIIFGIFLFAINLITFIIRKCKKISDNKKIYPNNKIVFILLLLPIIYAIFGNIYYNYSLKQDKSISIKLGKEYLEKKYSDNFIFKNIEIDGGYYMLGQGDVKNYLISYMIDNQVINVRINMYTREIINDNYLEIYLSNLLNNDEKYSYSLENNLIYNYIHNIENDMNEENILLDFKDKEIKLDQIDTINIKKIKSVSDLKEYIVLKKPIIYLNNDFSDMNVEEFNDYILNIYKLIDNKYNKEDENIMKFNFKYNNPFAKSSYYEDGGYIKELKDKYLIYVNSKPTEIEK